MTISMAAEVSICCAVMPATQRVGNDLVIDFVGTATMRIGGHFLAANTIERATDGTNTVTIAVGLIGGNASGIISGTDGAETLDGRGGNDLLYGNEGFDRLIGGDGDDLLVGGKSSDSLTGGAGRDTFRFYRGDGTDFILDFEIAADKIALSRASFGLAANATVANVVQIGGAAPTDGAHFLVSNGLVQFDADWGDTAGRENVLFSAAFMSGTPTAANFLLI
jgi:Ca2+-binding RTX toxin-like protein